MNKVIETPLISVLLSVYNDDENIKKSIDSILSQSYKNIELLVIDDGSTDKTYEILNDIKDSRLKIFRNKDNLGLTKSLNILIKKSQGQILARQDSDDISLPTRLEIQYNTLHKSQLDACTTRAFIKNTKKSIPRFSYLLPVNFVIKYKNPFIHGTLMVRKNAVLNVGMYDENIKYAQDYKLFIELLKKNYKIKILKNKLYVLNMENNISSLKRRAAEFFQKNSKGKFMKISIGSKIIDGPFGGGMEFLKNLISFLENNGHIVINHLNDKDIDVILLTNPLISSETSTFDSYDIEFYLKFTNSQAIVFQRFNECDERKGTNNINFKLNKFNQVVDVNIFVSDWLKNVFNHFDLSKKKSYVVKGGPNKDIFNNKNKIYWNKKSKLKLVTHHWSDNLMKGYLEYKKLDNFLESEKNRDLFDFTFIGNKPKDIKFNNIKVLEPLEGKELANVLKLHDIYITASENEPSGNHHMEGALCGLPIMYK